MRNRRRRGAKTFGYAILLLLAGALFHLAKLKPLKVPVPAEIVMKSSSPNITYGLTVGPVPDEEEAAIWKSKCQRAWLALRDHHNAEAFQILDE